MYRLARSKPLAAALSSFKVLNLRLCSLNHIIDCLAGCSPPKLHFAAEAFSVDTRIPVCKLTEECKS